MNICAFTVCIADANLPPMAWKLRHKIAVGTARGLHYLHKECQRRIIHRDIKASNILLTTNFEPQALLPTLKTAEQVSYNKTEHEAE